MKKPTFSLTFMNRPDYTKAMKNNSWMEPHKFACIVDFRDFKYSAECEKLGQYYPDSLCGQQNGTIHGSFQPQSQDLRYPRKNITRAQAAIIHPELVSEIERIEKIIKEREDATKRIIKRIRAYNKKVGLTPNHGIESLVTD